MVNMAQNNGENGLKQQTDIDNTLNSENRFPDRKTVLAKLYSRALWIGSKIDNGKTQLDSKLHERVNMARAECQFYSVILDGLKDVELDDLKKEIEQIKEVLEHEHKHA
jgi:hypothetical protein